MKKILLLLSIVAVAVAGFGLGRITAAPPQFQSQASDSDTLDAAFEDWLRAQRETLELLRASPFFDDEQSRAEAYRGVLYATIGSIKAGALQSHDYPRFMRAVDWTSKAGLDNPDNNYYVALIDDDADYRILGRRGSAANMIFQLVVGQPGVRGAGSSTNISVLYDRDMAMDAEGRYEIIVSPNNPGDGVNWLPSGEGAQALLLRFTHNDWGEEKHAAPYIEKIGFEGTHQPPLDAAAMVYGLREAAVSLYDRSATWLDYASKAWTLTPRNDIGRARPSQGGLVGQYSAFGNWELEDDQALVIETHRSPARYQGIELGNRWFVSLDYETHTSSLNLAQMHCGEDDRCFAVISHRDPGIQNWLDTEGHRQGLILLRWQGLQGEMLDAWQPSAKLVPFNELRANLPADTPEFSAEDRARQINDRRRAVQSRFGG